MVTIRICPKCKNANLEQESTRGMFAIAGVQPIFTCNDCGHSGTLFPEIDEKNYQKLKKNADNNS